MKLKTIGFALGATAFAAGGIVSASAMQTKPSAKAEQKSPSSTTKQATGGRGAGQTTRSASAFTGFPVTVNVDYYNTNEAQNPEKKPLIIVATCNATSEGKELNGWVGANAPSNFQKMVASESGTQRASVTYVVPWGWWYKVETKAMVGGAPTVPSMTCEATGWLVY